MKTLKKFLKEENEFLYKPYNNIVYNNTEQAVEGYWNPEGQTGPRKFQFSIKVPKNEYQPVVDRLIRRYGRTRKASELAFKHFQDLATKSENKDLKESNFYFRNLLKKKSNFYNATGLDEKVVDALFRVVGESAHQRPTSGTKPGWVADIDIIEMPKTGNDSRFLVRGIEISGSPRDGVLIEDIEEILKESGIGNITKKQVQTGVIFIFKV